MMLTVDETLTLVATGTKICRSAVEGLDETAYDGATALPGWTRRHLVAHLAANAEALGRLLHWASTGEKTPMYSSPEQRARDIDRGAALTGAELTDWFHRTADELAQQLDALPADRWTAEVVTAQGRTVPAREIPWLRCREVMVHAVDLGTGVSFKDLPHEFLLTLRDEVLRKRSAESVPPLTGPLPDVVAHLTGRFSVGVTTTEGAPAPALGPWL
jgi:maleylpyruvate isomerase